MQFLVTFCFFEAMRFNLSGGVFPISSFYINLQRWSMEDWTPSRFVQIELFSLPSSAWSSTNMTSITNKWGKVRRFDERTMKGISFENASVLIVTETMELIDGHVNFVLGNHIVLEA